MVIILHLSDLCESVNNLLVVSGVYVVYLCLDQVG